MAKGVDIPVFAIYLPSHEVPESFLEKLRKDYIKVYGMPNYNTSLGQMELSHVGINVWVDGNSFMFNRLKSQFFNMYPQYDFLWVERICK